MYELSAGGVRDDAQIRIVCSKPGYLLIVAAGRNSPNAHADSLRRIVKQKLDELLLKGPR